MNSTKLTWQSLQSDLLKYKENFFYFVKNNKNSLSLIQPRLLNALKHLHYQKFGIPILLIRSEENSDYLYQISILAKQINNNSNNKLFGGEYCFANKNNIILNPPCNLKSPFTSKGEIKYVEWIELEQLFGYIRIYKDEIKLKAGLLHQVNGGTLIIGVSILLNQPIIWKRLKNFILKGNYEWLSYPNERNYLPISIPSLPFKLKLIICGNRDDLLSFQKLDSETYKTAIYTEFEEQIYISNDEDMLNWCNWIKTLSNQFSIKKINNCVWPLLINEGIRYTGDHKILPLCPRWLLHQLREALSSNFNEINAKNLNNSIKNKLWRENYVNECINNEILSKQIIIDTEGSVVGQINGLSLVEIPGHPRTWGEPSRITCVVHTGNGDFIDIERQSDLSGNIHTKGMMILQSYLFSELNLEYQFPFSVSIVFEQSYSEIDGDSASLAELCALISALSHYPITQQIAVTGSIDQFGNVQPVGGLNEKIEAFFYLCNHRILTGKQGVIIPFYNIRSLSLHIDVINAVKKEKFHIWAVKNVDETIEILTNISWKKNKDNCILKKIKNRIFTLNKKEINHSSLLLNWFKRLIRKK